MKYSGILPFALRASLRLFKIAPGDFVERFEYHVRGAATVPIVRTALTAAPNCRARSPK